MRLFIGIGLPIPSAERLAKAARSLFPSGEGGGRIRWTQPGNLHVTLSFLGQVETARLEQIQQSLALVHAFPLHLELSGIGAFAGVLLAKVKPSAALIGLAEQIFVAMENCGFARDSRPYMPHVTLARTKGQVSAQHSGGGNAAFWQAFEAREFRLYESFTRPEGAHYQVLRAFPLA